MTPILFFDTGPIISLTMSKLDWILPPLKEKFGGKFYITPAVYRELIERPLQIKRFQFEALNVMKMVREGLFEVYTKVPKRQVGSLISLANNSFLIDGKPMDIIQEGEMESITCALQEKAAGLVMDERTLRLLIEDMSAITELLEARFQKKVIADKVKIKQLNQNLAGISIIRSIELVAAGYKMGILDSYLPPGKGNRDALLDAVLWTVKYNGCAVISEEIDELKRILNP